MKKSILLALTLGLFSSLSNAAEKTKKTEAAAPAAAETKKAEKAEKKAEPKAEKAEKKAEAKPEKKPAAKPGELSDSDKELQADAKKQADTLTASQKSKLLDLVNKGDEKAIQEINGLGEVKAKSFIAKRPFTAVEDVVMVDGIGIGTFGNIITFAKGEQAKEEPKKEEKKAAPAKEEKKAEPKAEKKPKAEKEAAPAKEEAPAKKKKAA